MPNPLAFEYRARQRDIPWEDPDRARRISEQRDRELEDFLNRPAPVSTGSQRWAYIKVGIDLDASLPGFVLGDGILDETYQGFDDEYVVNEIGGEQPVVEIEVPEDGVYHVSSEFLIILDAPATEDYQIKAILANSQSDWLDPFGRTHQELLIKAPSTHVEGSMAGMFSMMAGDSFFLQFPLLDRTGAENVASGVFTVAVAWYATTSPPVA